MDQRTVEKYILTLKDVTKSFPYGKGLIVYSVGDQDFAIIEDGKKPVRLSLRCDPALGRVLKERYEEVMSGHKLNKDKWISITISGQLKDSEIEDLIRLGHKLALKSSANLGL